MAQILFKKRFAQAILRGEKTTTLRRWKSPRVRAGTRAMAPGIGWLNILACDPINLKDLTEGDALADGFPSLDDLFKTLAQLYPDHKTDGRRWFRIAFSHDTHQPTPIQTARKRVVRQIRADLDKAVRQSGSLSPL
jgi:hypothetical protein